MLEMDVNKEVQSAIPAIMKKVKEEALDRIQREALQVVIQESNKAARDWAIEVLVPEVRAQLEAGKQGMIAKAEEISKSLAEEVGKALVEQAIRNMKNSWTVKDVASKIFG